MKKQIITLAISTVCGIISLWMGIFSIPMTLFFFLFLILTGANLKVKKSSKVKKPKVEIVTSDTEEGFSFVRILSDFFVALVGWGICTLTIPAVFFTFGKTVKFLWDLLSGNDALYLHNSYISFGIIGGIIMLIVIGTYARKIKNFLTLHLSIPINA